MVEAPVPSPSHSSPPSPMETGGVGDGQSWANRLKLVRKQNSGRSDPPNVPVLNQGDGGWV